MRRRRGRRPSSPGLQSTPATATGRQIFCRMTHCMNMTHPFLLTQHTAFLTVEVPRGVVTGRLGHAGTTKQLVYCNQDARGSWGCSPLACWRYNVDYLETSSS
ncbi:hypothetical protein VPH35_129629 [Triticum aestivum]|uniref:uncharacterized protein n=1 Tax=Triticum aestivum TaxID=4565 RepID=UPI000842F95A|nr:uncharacterized protein LOC123158914 [Triticum aestivum]